MLILVVSNIAVEWFIDKNLNLKGLDLKKLETLKYRLVAIFILNILFSLNVLAVKFYSINSLYGISMRETNSVCKDDNGFIWASSKTGILRPVSYTHLTLPT